MVRCPEKTRKLGHLAWPLILTGDGYFSGSAAI